MDRGAGEDVNDNGALPFPRKRLKHVVSLRKSRVDGPGGRRPYVGMENIESWTGRLLPGVLTTDANGSPPPAGAASLSNTFETGDVLFGKLRPYLAKAWVAEFAGRCSTELLAMKPLGVLPGFLRYLCLWPAFVDEVDASTFGSKMPRADWDAIGNVAVPAPAVGKQRAICDFLDRETARLDVLVAENRRLLEALRERRAALISTAALRGLNPDVSLRDSGVPWIGDVPSHWEIWKLGHLASVGNGSTPNRGQREYWENGDVPWLNSSVVNQEEVTGADQFVTRLAVHDCHLPLVNRGSVILAITGQGKTRGRAAILSIDSTINQHLAFIRPKTARLSSWYLKWTFSACYDYLRTISDDLGGTKGALTCEHLANLRVPVPPEVEQQKIVTEIASRTRAIDDLAKEAERTIGLLKERRASLISAAIAGVIDVEGGS